MPKTNAELMVRATTAGFEARLLLQQAYQAGLERPVPAATFTSIRMKLMEATCAVQELENRAKGFEVKQEG